MFFQSHVSKILGNVNQIGLQKMNDLEELDTTETVMMSMADSDMHLPLNNLFLCMSFLSVT